MGPELYFWYAIIQAMICAWSIWLWRTQRAPGARLIAFAAAMLAYDNGVLASGHLIGQGPTLETLSLFRYGIFLTASPITALAAVHIAIAARAGTPSAGAGRIAARAIISLLLAYGLFVAMGGFTLEPACLNGTLRYAGRVPINQLCNPGQIVLTSTGLPVSLIVSDVLVAIIGAVIWAKRSWPWLFVASIVVFVAAKFPYEQFGQAIANASAIAWMLAFAVTSARFASMPAVAADTFASTMKFNDTASFATRTTRGTEL